MTPTIRAILGETATELDSKPSDLELAKMRPSFGSSDIEDVASPEEGPGEPVADYITDLANAWSSGNREHIVDLLPKLSNVDAIKLMFEIGRKGAIELGFMLDSRNEPEEKVVDAEPEIENQPNTENQLADTDDID